MSADPAIGVTYQITLDRDHGIHGQFVIANHGSTPVSGWRVTVVLPGDTGYQVRNARNRSAGDAVVMAPLVAGQALAAGSTTLIAFTARGATTTPVRCTFRDAARQQPDGNGSGLSGSGASLSGSGSGPDTGRPAAGQPGSGRDGHGGWPGGWPQGGWPGQGDNAGGWNGGTGGGWTGGGTGPDHGWPGGG